MLSIQAAAPLAMPQMESKLFSFSVSEITFLDFVDFSTASKYALSFNLYHYMYRTLLCQVYKAIDCEL